MSSAIVIGFGGQCPPYLCHGHPQIELLHVLQQLPHAAIQHRHRLTLNALKSLIYLYQTARLFDSGLTMSAGFG